MLMPNRSYTVGSQFRYGFNGKENDNDVKGTGNQQDYGMRIYDPRIGKFLSVDPLKSGYPHLTPYQFAGNTPIQAIDLDGMEPQGFMIYWKETSSEYMTKWNFTVQDVYDYETKKVWTVMHYPNTNQYFYWETKYENAQRLFSPENTNLNKINGEWSGFFKEFKPKQFSEDKSLYYGMVGMLATPFVALGAVEAGAAAYFSVQSVLVSGESYLTRAITKGLLEYWKHVSTVSYVGREIIGLLDESGAVGAQNAAIGKVERYTANEIRKFITTEEGALFNVGAMKEIIEKGGNLFRKLQNEPIFAVIYQGKTYILDGHNRLKAALELEKEANVTILSNEEAWKTFKDKMDDIIQGNFNKALETEH